MCSSDLNDIQFMLRARDHRRDDQRGFAWQRNADTFGTDNTCDHQESVSMDEMGNRWHVLCVPQHGPLYSFVPKMNSLTLQLCLNQALSGSPGA